WRGEAGCGAHELFVGVDHFMFGVEQFVFAGNGVGVFVPVERVTGAGDRADVERVELLRGELRVTGREVVAADDSRERVQGVDLVGVAGGDERVDVFGMASGGGGGHDGTQRVPHQDHLVEGGAEVAVAGGLDGFVNGGDVVVERVEHGQRVQGTARTEPVDSQGGVPGAVGGAGVGVGVGFVGGVEVVAVVGPAVDEDLRSEEHTSERQSRDKLVCRLL